jgi:hypothetical protein
MADTAAHLVDRVLPELPVRQWVLSLPFALRYRLAYDARLASLILAVFVRTVFASLRRRARRQWGLARSQCGAVTFVQRFGDSTSTRWSSTASTRRIPMGPCASAPSRRRTTARWKTSHAAWRGGWPASSSAEGSVPTPILRRSIRSRTRSRSSPLSTPPRWPGGWPRDPGRAGASRDSAIGSRETSRTRRTSMPGRLRRRQAARPRSRR